MKTYDIPGNPDGRLKVAGDAMMLEQRMPQELGGDYAIVRAHTTTYHMDTPFFVGLEAFCDYAGDGLRVGVAQLEMGDRIIYLYDHRPAFYPVIGDVVSEKRRKDLREARKEEPELFGPAGEMLEYQQGGNFGYGWNLDMEYGSEWGYAPFPQAGESITEMNSRITEGIRAFMGIMDDDDRPEHGFFVIDTGGGVAAAAYDD